MIICVRCGQMNQDGQKYCQSCNASLPRIAESVSAPPPERINVHFNQLKEVGESIQNNAISKEEFLSTLDRIYSIIYDRLQDIETMEISEEIRPSLDEQLQIGVSGIHLFLNGIEEMRLYANDSNPQHIISGMESVADGNENLNQALEMARENLRRLKDMGIDSEFDITGD